MKGKLQIDNSLFGIPYYRMDIPGLAPRRAGLVQAILQQREESEGIKRSNSGGWHSTYDLHETEVPEIKWLVEQVTKVGKNCIAHAIKVDKKLIQMMNLWANVNEAGDWNAPHAHFPSQWSGVCYIQINEQAEELRRSPADGNIFFMNPLPLGPLHRRPISTNVRPENGRMLMFPAYLVHMVAPHFDDTPRISVAFNFRVKQKKEEGHMH